MSWDPKPRQRNQPVFAVLAAGSVLAGLSALFAWWPLASGEAVAPDRPPRQVAEPAPLLARSAPRADIATTALSAVAPAAVEPGEQTLELCGTARFPLRSGGGGVVDSFEALPVPLGSGLLRDLQERLLQALSVGDARQRVAAWLLREPADGPDAQAAWAAAVLAEARTGGDAQALQWAAVACGAVADEAGCRLELAQARVRAEPDNGLHWLELAQQAPEGPLREAAWKGLVQAPHWREYPAGLTATTQAALATLRPPVPEYLRVRMARDTLGWDSGRPPAAFDSLEQHCAEAPSGGARRSACAAVAQQMLESADSAALLQQAARLGAVLGWSQERLQAVAATTQAFHASLPMWAEDVQTAWGCPAVQAQLTHAEAVARRGEVAPRRLR